MDSLLLTMHTRQQLRAIAVDPPHAILLTGARGIGKRTIAFTIATQLTEVAYTIVIEPDEKDTISIETIRSLYMRTRSRSENRQVIIIDHAECMGGEAQNAFLKLLEEPRAGVTFILTAPNNDLLLPTITSRVQTIAIPRISQHVLQNFIAKHPAQLQAQELTQLLFVANGRPGILVRLLNEPEVFERHKQLMIQAKNMVAASAYERLSLMANIAKNREDAIHLLDAMARIVHSQLLRGPNESLISLADDIQICLARLAQNSNARAQLTYLFIRH